MNGPVGVFYQILDFIFFLSLSMLLFLLTSSQYIEQLKIFLSPRINLWFIWVFLMLNILKILPHPCLFSEYLLMVDFSMRVWHQELIVRL